MILTIILVWREYMRIKIKVDVRKSLRRKKKISRKNRNNFVIPCRYEWLGDLCFTCEMLSHIERFSRKKIDQSVPDRTKEWGAWLRAPSRRGGGQIKSKWLKDDGDANCENRYGKENLNQNFSEENVESSDIRGRENMKIG